MRELKHREDMNKMIGYKAKKINRVILRTRGFPHIWKNNDKELVKMLSSPTLKLPPKNCKDLE